MLRRINPSPGIEGKAFAIAKAGHEALLVVGSVLNRDCGENVETRAAQGWIGTRPAAQIKNRRIDPNDVWSPWEFQLVGKRIGIGGLVLNALATRARILLGSAADGSPPPRHLIRRV
jgi:hypothetical protein